MSNAPPTPDLLTEGQRRHLTAILDQVEQHLLDIVALADGSRSGAPTVFGGRVQDLPRGFVETVRPSIADATATLAELGLTLGLTRPPASRFRAVQALVMSSVVVAEDAASRNLTGYGAIHPDLPRLLDPLVGRLHEQLLDIGRALPTPPSAGETSG